LASASRLWFRARQLLGLDGVRPPAAPRKEHSLAVLAPARLRLADNLGLAPPAVAHRCCPGVYVIDPAKLAAADQFSGRLWFLARACANSRQGLARAAPTAWCSRWTPVALLPSSAHASALRGAWNREDGACRAERDRKVAATLQAWAESWLAGWDQLLFPPIPFSPAVGDPYRVYAAPTGAAGATAGGEAAPHSPPPGAQAGLPGSGRGASQALERAARRAGQGALRIWPTWVQPSPAPKSAPAAS